VKPNIQLTEKNRKAVVRIINTLLADEFILATQTRNGHWNVTGPRFHDLHTLFASQYEILDTILDDVAERTRALGGHALGTATEFLKLARLREQPGELPRAAQMTAALLASHEVVIRQLREDLVTCAQKHGDAGTADFLTGLMEQHEKMAWMLRAVLEGKR
jgi:starvation-inducible DNA-binding protein